MFKSRLRQREQPLLEIILSPPPKFERLQQNADAHSFSQRFSTATPICAGTAASRPIQPERESKHLHKLSDVVVVVERQAGVRLGSCRLVLAHLRIDLRHECVQRICLLLACGSLRIASQSGSELLKTSTNKAPIHQLPQTRHIQNGYLQVVYYC